MPLENRLGFLAIKAVSEPLSVRSIATMDLFPVHRSRLALSALCPGALAIEPATPGCESGVLCFVMADVAVRFILSTLCRIITSISQ